MAVSKEAIAIVLDIGKSMHSDKSSPTVLDQAKNCINMIVQRKIFSESKDEMALILVGSYETSNCVNKQSENSSQYSNIKIVQEFQPANWELLEYVKNVEGTDISTDLIRENALLTGINLLHNAISGKKFFSRRILFISDFSENFYSHKVSKICEELNVCKIDLNVIGPVAFSIGDCAEESEKCSQLCKQESQVSEKAEKYSIRKILKEVNGESYSFSEALPALIYYQKKKVVPMPWNGNLDIGTNLTIPISAYTKVTESKPKAWKSAYAHKLSAKIERGFTYIINDENQTKISKEDIVPAFKYGTTLVPYSEEDKLNMDYQSGEKGMKVLGFTKAENVERYHYAGDKSMYIFGQKNRELSGVILAPFIQALHDTKMVAIVRYVYSQRSSPKIGFLSPKIKPEYDCLVFVGLPFMEDLRHFIFTPLDSDSKNVPSGEQIDAVDDLITAMDLTLPVDEEDNNTEMMKPKSMVNPYSQRLYQCLQHKAFNPEKPLPAIMPHINSLITPNPKLMERAQSSFKKIQLIFEFKENILQKTTEHENLLLPSGKSDLHVKKETENADVDLQINMLDTVTDKITKVGTVNPVRDFQYLISNQMLLFEDSCQQMIDVVFQLLKDTTNLKLYHSRILSMCKELRRASLKEHKPLKYNSFMTNLQNVLLECDLELWDKIKSEKIGLISKTEIPSSLISVDEAEHFMSICSSQNNKDSPKIDEINNEEDCDDLLGQM